MKEIFVLGFVLYSWEDLITPPYGPAVRIKEYHDFLHNFNAEKLMKELRVSATVFYPYAGLNRPFSIDEMLVSYVVLDDTASYKMVKVDRKTVDNFLLKSQMAGTYNLSLGNQEDFEKITRAMIKELPNRLSERFFSFRLGLDAYILKDNTVVVKDALSYKYNVIGVLDNAKNFKALIDLLYDYYVLMKRSKSSIALSDADLYSSFSFKIPQGIV